MEDNKPKDSLAGIMDDDDDLITAMNQVQKEESYIENTDQVRIDLDNANTMLSYIVDRGLELDPKHLEVIVESKDRYRSKKWTKETEIKFYMTYMELTKIIKPVTVDSLASSRPTNLQKVGRIGQFFGRKTKGSLSKRSTTGYTICTVVCMFLLLGVQIYFYLGSTRLDSIAESEEESSKAFKRMCELGVILQNNNDMGYTSEFEDCQSMLEEYDHRKLANIELLEPWVQNLRRLSFNTTLFTDTIAKSDVRITQAHTAIIQEAKSYRLILGVYILPLLYGIIGGFTFVLRELTSEIKDLTFSTGSNIKYILRILLGAIAGLAIGLFWGDIQNVQQFGITSLSPMLLAFLGGYCVEYLLQFLERIATSFFKKNVEYYESKPIEEGGKPEPKKPEPKDGKDAAAKE